MKLTIAIILISLMQVSATVYSQQTKFNFNFAGSFEDLMIKIEENSEFRFFYKNSQIPIDKQINLNIQDNTVEDILNTVLEDEGIVYTIMGDNLIILTKNFEKKIISNNQQGKLVTGVVSDSNGQSIPGLTVSVKGTGRGVITDAEGKYSINLEEGENILVFSYVGMETQEISVGSKTSVNVTMSEKITGLDEVIVVGYSTKKKRDITGSITSVSGSALAESRTESFTQALQGRAAGVYVTSNSGQPGGGVSVRIRGIGGLNSSEPLYIIDGVQITGSSGNDNSNPLASLNPNDIESLEVLKDASSAAIYGARGANGVVIITTKRGVTGKPRLSYRGSFGVQNITNVNNFGVLNARQYAERVNTTAMADGGAAIFGGSNTSQYPVEYFPDPSELGKGTDWLDVIFAGNAPLQEHQLSFDGGTEGHNYYVSLNYLDQDGLVDRTYYKRYTFRINTDNKINKFIKVGNSLTFSHSTSNYYWATRTGSGGLLIEALSYAPTIPIYNEDNTWAGPPTAFYPPYRTPFARINSNNNDRRVSRLMGNVYGDVSILKGLTFRTSFSVDLNLNTNESWGKTYDEGIVSDNTAGVYNTSDRGGTWIWSNVFNFSRSFDKHNISAVLGTEASESKSDHFMASAEYEDNGIRIVSPTSSVTYSVDEWKSAWSLISYFGNLSYNFDNRYYIEGNIRRDGSSRFGANSRWGIFPSFSGAWRISKEHFFPIHQISDLKLRASYGEVGNNNIGDFAYLAGLTSVLYSFGDVDGSFSNGLAINEVANPDLKWETSKQINIGFDLAMFEDKLTFSADYFKTKVSDMLLGVSIPAVTGINASVGLITLADITTNAGSLENKGIELEAGYHNKVGEITYSIDANLTTFNNLVTDLGGNEQIWGQTIDGQNVSRTVEGGSLGEFYGYVVEGIFQNQEELDAANSIDNVPSTPYQNEKTAPGDYKFKDIDGDGAITDADRTVIGSPIPDFTYGMNVKLGYKNFDFSMLFTGTQGNDIFNATRINLEASGLTNFNKSKAVLNGWNGEGTSNTIARAIGTDPNQNKRISSIFVEDGSFLRLREVQLSYKLPIELIKKASMSSARVYISGQNLLTFTNYSGFDPEVGNLSGNNKNAGIDNDVYPQVKSISVGVQITF